MIPKHIYFLSYKYFESIKNLPQTDKSSRFFSCFHSVRQPPPSSSITAVGPLNTACTWPCCIGWASPRPSPMGAPGHLLTIFCLRAGLKLDKEGLEMNWQNCTLTVSQLILVSYNSFPWQKYFFIIPWQASLHRLADRSSYKLTMDMGATYCLGVSKTSQLVENPNLKPGAETYVFPHLELCQLILIHQAGLGADHSNIQV